MTGPEHYVEAESCLDAAKALATAHDATGASLTVADRLIATAQAHATLALAAATAYPAVVDYYGDEDRSSRGWVEVTT